MRACKDKLRELLPEYVHGLLNPEEMARIADHIKACDDCASEISVLSHLSGESIPEPPQWFYNTLPGKVTAEGDARRKRRVRVLVPVWAGGLAAAAIALLIILRPVPVPQHLTDVEEYASLGSSGSFYMGLEEEILLFSGSLIEDLDKPLVADLGLVSEEYMAAADLVPGGDGYETMDEITIGFFEDLVDEMTPERVRKRVI